MTLRDLKKNTSSHLKRHKEKVSHSDQDDVSSNFTNDSSDRLSATVTVNEAVGDELSLGDEDFSIFQLK